jgi:hypothetical protein
VFPPGAQLSGGDARTLARSLRQTLTVITNPPPAKDTRTRVRRLVEEELERGIE